MADIVDIKKDTADWRDAITEYRKDPPAYVLRHCAEWRAQALEIRKTPTHPSMDWRALLELAVALEGMADKWERVVKEEWT